MLFIIDDTEVSFLVQYTKGTKMSYNFSLEGLLTVRAPLKTTQSEIEDFLTKQKKKILPTIERYNNRIFVSSKKSYDKNEIFLLFGAPQTFGQLLDDTGEDLSDVQQALKSLYIRKTTKYIKKQLPKFEKLLNVKAKSVSIVDNPKAWGTCSSRKELTFNYKLSMAPPSVIDSVIVHELCHISHLNHDRSFWRLVGKYDPQYKNHLNYLSKFGSVMTI